jgi:hypothetical protein
MSLYADLLSWLCDGYWPTADGQEELVVRAQDGQHCYTPLRLLASGDVADIHLATTACEPHTATQALYLLKIARVPEGNAHLDIERKTLTRLLGVAGNTTYRNYVPALVDSFSATGRFPQRINVFRWEPGFYTLEQVHEQHPALDGRHLAWIFKRLLTVLGFSHRQNVIHGRSSPATP